MKLKMSSFVRVPSIAVLAACVLIPAPSHAATVVYETGFESPGFVPGDLVGQDGVGQDGWTETGDAQKTVVTAANGIVDTGSQSLGIIGDDSSRSSIAQLPILTVNPEGVVEITTRMYLGPAESTSALWRILAFGGGNGNALYGGFRLFSSNGELLITNAAGDTRTNIFPTRNQWHTYTLLLDLEDQEISGLFNGVPVSPTLDLNSEPTSQLIVQLRPANIEDEFAYFDNIRVTATPIPEPTGLALLASGGMLLICRRRR
ncbi:MAG: PEP-CTERM sorting domain-containing protein [Planctomycetota bacterium]